MTRNLLRRKVFFVHLLYVSEDYFLNMEGVGEGSEIVLPEVIGLGGQICRLLS